MMVRIRGCALPFAGANNALSLLLLRLSFQTFDTKKKRKKERKVMGSKCCDNDGRRGAI